MAVNFVNDSNGLQRVIVTEPAGSSLEVLLHGGQVVSWKNSRGEELLFIKGKNSSKSTMAFLGGISICFRPAGITGPFDKYKYPRRRLWSLENDPLNQGSHSFVNLILKASSSDSKLEPMRMDCNVKDELRLNISLSPGKLALTPSVKNIGDKSVSFTFAIQNHLFVSDISEVRIEGLETLDYLDNTQNQRRFTEQADALTFDGETNRSYLNTPSRIAIIDHGKKRTFAVNKQGLPDAVVWNPWDKASKSCPCVGDEYNIMMSLHSAVLEKPVVLKPFQVWTGSQEIVLVSSSYCSGQLDPIKAIS